MLPQIVVRPGLARLGGLLYPLACAASLAVIAVGTLAHFNYLSVWDDAFMFARYADNVLRDGVMAWNPGGEPTYGLTSSLFLSLVVPLRMLIPQNPLLAVLAASIAGGVLFIGLLVALLAREPAASPRARRALVLFALLTLALNVYDLNIHMTSGMDTTFSLACITAYIMLAVQFRRAPTALRTAALGVAGGLAFLVRPDLLLYTWLLPLVLALCDVSAPVRRQAVAALALTVALTGAQAAGAAWYFHTPVPLPFYAKALPNYGDVIREVYRDTPVQQLSVFLMSFAVLIVPAGAGVWLDLRSGLRTAYALERGLLAATILFVLYYLLFVTQIMPRGQRFYFPTLPALFWLAAHASILISRRLPALAHDIVRAPATLPGMFIVFLLLLLPVGRSQVGTLRFERDRGRFGDVAPFSIYDAGAFLIWFQLDEFSKLPDDFVIATTEVGLPAALNPRKVIVDMAGLNETQFALAPFSARRLFAKYAPDLIYMPHPTYPAMTAELGDDPTFRSRYEIVPLPPQYGAAFILGVAIRRDSRYYADMQRIIAMGKHGLVTAVP